MKSCTPLIPIQRMRCRHGCCLRSVASLPAIVSCSKHHSAHGPSAAKVFNFVVHAEHALTYLKAMQHWTRSFSLQPSVMLGALLMDT